MLLNPKVRGQIRAIAVGQCWLVPILPDSAEPQATNIATAVKTSAQRTVSRL